jgi:hypothetical protein
LRRILGILGGFLDKSSRLTFPMRPLLMAIMVKMIHGSSVRGACLRQTDWSSGAIAGGNHEGLT